MTELPTLVAAFIGITSAYLFESRERGRLRAFLKHPNANWTMFVFDYIACGFVGMAASYYLFEAKTVKEGFLLGLTWEAGVMALVKRHNAKGTR